MHKIVHYACAAERCVDSPNLKKMIDSAEPVRSMAIWNLFVIETRLKNFRYFVVFKESEKISFRLKIPTTQQNTLKVTHHIRSK